MSRLALTLCLVAGPALADPSPFPTARLTALLGLHPAVAVAVTREALAPLPCRVLGTLRSVKVEQSFATVECTARPFEVRPGDALLDATVIAIGHGVITVRRGDREEELGRGIAARAALSPPRADAPPTSAPDTVKRETVEALLRDPSPLLSQVQFMPAFNGGRWAGVRASYVREGSMLATMGLRTGDVIRAVNGQAIDSVPSALGVVQGLSRASGLEVELERGGAVITRRVKFE
ncbi:MAG: PDZ domain-containing protein [Myxococcaceae bacterium]